MKNTTLTICIIILVLFAGCKKDTSANPSNQEKVTYNKGSLQNAVTTKDNPLERFEGLSLSNEMIEKIISHTADQKIVKVIKNSRGLENLLGHPVIGTVTVINPNGKILNNFSANLHYKNDVVVEDSLKNITIFRSSFTSHKGDRLITSHRKSGLNDDENTNKIENKFNPYQVPTNNKYQTAQSISTNQSDSTNGLDGLSSSRDELSKKDNLKMQQETFSSENLEKYKIIENNINQQIQLTMSRILTLQDILEDPIIINNNDLNDQFHEELIFQYDLLETQQELKKELEENKLIK